MSMAQTFEKALEDVKTVRAARDLFSEVSRDLGYQWFDAMAMTSTLIADPRRAGRYFVSNYFTGDIWSYFPRDWPADDEVIARTARSSTPIDYVEALQECDATASIVLQRGVLKTFGVRRAWLFPHSTLGEYRAVTCYITQKSSDTDAVFQGTRDQLYGMSARFIDKLDVLHRDEAERRSSPIVVNKIPVILSSQETTCLQLLAKGAGNETIALELDVSVNTVKYHLKKIFRKLGVRSRAEATAVALDHGLI